MKKILLFLIVFSEFVFAASISGVIKDDHAQTPDVVVTLTPPKNSTLSKHVTSTREGQYEINDVQDARYLFEVKFKGEVVYQEVLNISGDLEKDVVLTNK